MSGTQLKGESNHGLYLFTTDLCYKVAALSQLGIKVPALDDPIFAKVDGEITATIKKCNPSWEVRAVDVNTMAQDILAKAIAHDESALMGRGTIVSTCPEIAAPTRGFTIEINRIVSDAGASLGVGSRPGYSKIRDQINSLAALKSPVVLVEDGSFSGRTLVFLLDMLHKARVKVTAVVIGIAFPKALEEIKRIYSEELIVIEDGINSDRLVDWMPDHDFIPFTPNCGRVVGTLFRGEPNPHYDHRGFSTSVPYLKPFLDSATFEDWTSLPKTHGRDFSCKCLMLAKQIFSHLSEINGRQLCIGDLQRGMRHVSLPHFLTDGNGTDAPDTSVPVDQVLQRYYNMAMS